MKTKGLFFSFLLLALAITFPGATRAQTAQPSIDNTRPDSIQDDGYWGYMANAPANVIHGGILQGKVTVMGDPLLWEPITVMLTCKTGKADLTTATDANGQYAITHVNLPKAYTTENDSLSTQMQQHYEGCALQAPLAGYHSSSITITQKNLRDQLTLGNIVLTPDEHAPGTAISTVGESGSPDATKAFTRAHEEWLHRDSTAAQKDLESAVQADPQFAEAWYLLGRLQIGSDLAAATESFTKAQAADPKFVLPCVYLAGIAIQQKNWPEADRWTSRALQLDPAGTSRVWYYAAQAQYRMGKNEAARSSAQNAMAMDPEHEWPMAEDVLALTLLDKGDHNDALAHLRNTLTYVGSGPQADLVKRQIDFVQQQSASAKK
ncbi:MAG TPA: tetratricopeptide repeat protein [Acidobacteriaceae bacterium]